MPKIFRKEKIGNRRIFYLFDKKILSYHKLGGGVAFLGWKLNSRF